MRRLRGFILLLLAVAFNSCYYTKFVPQDKYLLNKARVRVEDTKDVQSDELKTYLRQKQNSEVLGFWKLQLNIWNWQGPDSAKWINRQLRKVGEAPEVFSPELAAQSRTQLKRAMDNKGYFLSTVDTTMRFRKRKVNVTYHIHAGTPYRLRNYKVDLSQPDLYRYATRRSTLSSGILFDADVLDAERQRITDLMRYTGYYYFEKDFLHYEADSSFSDHVVDLRLAMQEYIPELPDSVQNRLFRQYKVRHVVFHSSSLSEADSSVAPVLTQRGDYLFSVQGKRLLREKTLIRQCYVKPGELFNQRRVDRTYTSLNALGPVKYVDIRFEQVTDDELDCHITLSKAKVHGVTAELEGTFSAGDWGVAAGAGYVNRNIFRGAEELSVNGRVSYEWRQNGSNALEAKGEAALRFPSRVNVKASYSYQQRPEEFTRTIANVGVSYYVMSNRNRWRHTFDLLDISYVYLPEISDRFREEFLKPTNILKYSYEDHFIVDWSYSGSFSSQSKRNPLLSYSTVQYSVETAGNLLYGLSHLFGQEKNADGHYEIFKIPYAQYVKGDISWTYNHIFDKHNRLVWHAALGVAVPFGNASSIPFEKRYFAGGANSVRGWTMRSLGPGGYSGSGERIDFNNQSGDIKLDLNMEYRVRLVWALELAAFTDAGNIWTIREYDSQPYGVFRFSEFYRQIAWSYGVGVRLNFDFLVLRVDFGVKLYDPSRINYNNRFSSSYGGPWRTVANGLCWKDDMAFHFAIGYPF